MSLDSTALADIEMSRRLRNALTRANRYPGWEDLPQYESLNDLIGVTYRQIWCRPGFGYKSLAELEHILRTRGWVTQTKLWWEPFAVPPQSDKTTSNHGTIEITSY